MKNLKINLLIVIFVFISNFNTFAKDYKEIDDIIEEYPSHFSQPLKLAEIINRDFSLEDEKARAIYTWMAMHIKYDVKQLKSGKKQIKYSFSSEEERLQKEQEILLEIAGKTLRSKKAVCEGYASLYKVLCDLTAVECVMITGSTKSSELSIGKLPKSSDHKWNAVKINGEWQLIDATWGAGYGDTQTGKFVAKFTDTYFFTEPNDFYLNHYPEEEKWLLSDRTAEDFARLPYYYNYYLESEIRLDKNQNGLLKPDKEKFVEVVIDRENIGNIEYTFNRGKSFQEAQPIVKGGKSYYKIKARGSYLTILINNNAWAAFKIIRN